MKLLKYLSHYIEVPSREVHKEIFYDFIPTSDKVLFLGEFSMGSSSFISSTSFMNLSSNKIKFGDNSGYYTIPSVIYSSGSDKKIELLSDRIKISFIYTSGYTTYASISGLLFSID